MGITKLISATRYWSSDSLIKSSLITGTKLLMLLNVLDLLVCVTGVMQQCLLVAYGSPWPFLPFAAQVLNFILLEATGFATCLLSTTRCIIFYEPLKNVVKRRALALSFVVFISYLLVRSISLGLIYKTTAYLDVISFQEIYLGILLTEMGLMVLVVLLVNTVCIFELRQRNHEEAAYNHATITVAILSCSFCVLNTLYIVTTILYFFKNRKNNIVILLGTLYAVSLNSATNPLIYLARRRKMREYIQNLIKDILLLPRKMMQTMV